jgi:hypothetical protein
VSYILVAGFKGVQFINGYGMRLDRISKAARVSLDLLEDALHFCFARCLVAIGLVCCLAGTEGYDLIGMIELGL